MINYVHENMFDLDVDARVNPVNCAGVMGKGLALQFKNKYPDMYEHYKIMCQGGQIQLGRVYYCPYIMVKPIIKYVPNKDIETIRETIVLFPTKDHWRDNSELYYIEQGLISFVKTYEKHHIKSIAFPKLGCGCGGLNWEEEVKPLMEEYLGYLPINIYICI